MSDKTDIRWGILGTARIAKKRMIRAIQQSHGNTCAAIASREIAKAKRTAEEFKIPKYYGSYQELIKDDEIDAVYIPLPNNLHYQWVLKSAQNGKHILCEKPLTYSLSQVKEMIETSEKYNVVLLEAHSYFLHPQYDKLFKLLESNLIGKIDKLQVYFSFIAQKEHAIRFAPELGGGSFLDIGCYGIDLIHQIPDQKIQQIEAHFKSQNNVDMEFLGVLNCNSDIELIVRTSFLQDRQQSLLIHGKKGMIVLPEAFIPSGEKSYLMISSEEGNLVEEIENDNQFKLLIQEFNKQILSKQNLKIHFDRYLENTRVLETILNLRDNN